MSLTGWHSFLAALAAPAVLLLGGGDHPAFAQARSQRDVAQAAAPALNTAKSWGYQLQKVDPAVIAAAPYDMIVIDYSRDGSDGEALTANDIAKLKVKPDGSRRIVLAYLSIGEAESYRYYWKPDWTNSAHAPPWLAGANKTWRTNFLVRYWHPDWQAIVYGGDESYLAKIMAAGFDGVYLDRIDSYLEFENENPAARDQMVAFVKAMASQARARKPGFIVVPQNGEELVEDADYRAVIDGIAKEDLLFGDGRPKRANKPERVEENINYLKPMNGTGKPVFVVEYIDNPTDIASARRQIEDLGYIPHFADRRLDSMRIGDQAGSPARTRTPGSRK